MMVKCNSCGQAIADSAQRCPHCGDEHTPATLENTGVGLMGCAGCVAGAIVGAILGTVLGLSWGWGFLLTLIFGIAGGYLVGKRESGKFVPKR